MSYCTEYMIKEMEFKPPELDPIADRIEAALNAGLDISAVVQALDDLDGDTELEPEESDGGSYNEKEYGLSVNETICVHRECLCCGNVHSCEEIFVS